MNEIQPSEHPHLIQRHCINSYDKHQVEIADIKKHARVYTSQQPLHGINTVVTTSLAEFQIEH